MLRILFLMICISVLPDRGNAEVLSINQFRNLAPQSGEFQIKGYIVKHYECPPCPSPHLCEACMPDSVLISETDKLMESFPIEGNYLVITTPNSERLNLGKFYNLTVKVLDNSIYNSNYLVKDLELVRVGE